MEDSNDINVRLGWWKQANDELAVIRAEDKKIEEFINFYYDNDLVELLLPLAQRDLDWDHILDHLSQWHSKFGHKFLRAVDQERDSNTSKLIQSP